MLRKIKLKIHRLHRKIKLRNSGLESFYANLAQNITLVDIGASYFFAARWNHLLNMSPLNIVLVDPNSLSLNYLQYLPSNLNIVRIESAVSRNGGMQILYETNVLSGSSLLRPDLNFLNSASCPAEIRNYFLPVNENKIQTLSISALLQDFKNTSNFIKIDIQGYELELLKGAETFLKDGDIILLEIETSLVNNPVMENAAKLPEVINFLSAYGYQIMDLEPVYENLDTNKNRGERGVLGECDITFIADATELKFQKPDKLIAIFTGYIVYGYPRLAHRLLSENQILKSEISRRGFHPDVVLHDLISLHSSEIL
jgi:FkbM family methyltransferase